MKTKGKFTVDDLERNNISARDSGIPTKYDMLEAFRAAISAKRVLKVSKGDRFANDCIKYLQDCTAMASWKLFDHVDVQFVDESTKDNWQEILQYVYIMEDSKETLPDGLTESALHIRLVGPVVDNSFSRNLRGYNRNRQLEFPINFQVGNALFHTRPQTDFEIIQHGRYQVVGEGNVNTNTPNAVFATDLVKIVCIVRMIWESIQPADRVIDSNEENYKNYCCPFLLTSKDCFKMYIFYKDSNMFYYDLVNAYWCHNFSDMLQLAFHLRNLPIIQLEPAVAQNAKFKRKIVELRLPLGSSFSPRKNPRWQSGDSWRSNGAGGFHGSDIAEIQYQILNPSYEIDEPPPGFCRHSGKPVIIKQSQSPREIYFLNKLSAMIQDKRNVTIKPLEMIPSPDTENYVYYVFGRSAQLSHKTWLDLIQQLTEYVAFLHENRIYCDLMEEFSDPKKAIVKTFAGTVEYSLPEYVENPARGFNPFDLEMHSLKLTCGWMRRRAQATSG
ncbi:hypothetical protein BDR26DRAFT_855341 [Obelidium mucronatum]|nr:hypothetical protein BDR26DRAFT_855341 [Obelidium mucronatum]